MWLPGYERHEYPGLAGKSFQFTHNPKGCMHTTEGGSIAGAMSAYAQYPPHLIYDWRNRHGVQHISLNRAAYSAMDGNDDDYMIQVELVGFAAETRNWPEQALRNVAADVVAPLEQYFKIPRRLVWHGFKDGQDGIRPYIASPESPIRLDWAQLRDFSGWLGHQHLPAPDDHWDPGALPMQRILDYLSQEDDMFGDGDRVVIQEIWAAIDALSHGYGERKVAPRKGEPVEQVRHLYEIQHSLRRALSLQPAGDYAKGQAGQLPAPGQEFELVKLLKSFRDDLAAVKEDIARLETSGVPVTVDYQQAAKALADELDRRARDNDHNTGPTS